MKKDRIPKLIQETLSVFINENMPVSTFGALTTITEVKVSHDLSLAKIYVSFIPTGEKREERLFLTKIKDQNYLIKRYLADRLANKLRTIPNIQFYIDTTAKEAIAMQKILSSL